jgi:hypothetical protein
VQKYEKERTSYATKTQGESNTRARIVRSTTFNRHLIVRLLYAFFLSFVTHVAYTQGKTGRRFGRTGYDPHYSITAGELNYEQFGLG